MNILLHRYEFLLQICTVCYNVDILLLVWHIGEQVHKNFSSYKNKLENLTLNIFIYIDIFVKLIFVLFNFYKVCAKKPTFSSWLAVCKYKALNMKKKFML